MATELSSRTKDVTMTRFYGGKDRGVCVQVSSNRYKEQVQLTREQAAQLAHDLMAFADGLERELGVEYDS